MACLGHMPLTHKTGSSGQQYELLDWLMEVTFPMETRFANVDFARQAYELIVKRIIKSGVLRWPSFLYSFDLLILMLDNHLLQLRNTSSRSYQGTC
jgi:cytosine/adenosine deaminase-related metal-dependent hydrolase